MLSAPLVKGRYVVRFSRDAADIARAQHLRWQAFRAPRGGAGATVAEGRDADSHDRRCLHVLIEEACSGALAGCFRLMALADGRAISRSYSARFYDLSGLSRYGAPMAEIGRFCIRPGLHDPDILRIAWGAITRHVDDNGVGLLFGCSSFRGTEWRAHAEAFAALAQSHAAPPQWLPRAKAPEVVDFAPLRAGHACDPKRAMAAMPPLLRSYLAMGGWVGDHAVVDRDLGTLHVFTGLEIRAIPPGRARLLRAIGA